MTVFRSVLSETIFRNKYAHEGAETWEDLSRTLVYDVCGDLNKDDKEALVKYVSEMKFIPGGRYLYYAGRNKKYFNNCYLLRSEEDTREDWADLSWKAESCLLTGGGIGNDYSRYREEGRPIRRTGGVASGPIAKMKMINDIGRYVMQGGARRSAIYASLSVDHPDVNKFLVAKDWHNMPIEGGWTEKGHQMTVWDAKNSDFNYMAPLDMTNISVNYNTNWLETYRRTGDVGDVFRKNIEQALRTGEPGFSFNFFDKENETLRNACTEVTSEDDSDVCNLGSLNFSRIENLDELKEITRLATLFLLYGTTRADLPYDKVYRVREKNRRLGLGIMGLHEWLLVRGYRYEVVPELHSWLSVYKEVSDAAAKRYAHDLSLSNPVAVRSIAPTGTIGLVAGTTTGIEPVYAVAYKRRYLKSGTRWKYQYYVDHIAETLIERGVNPEDIESAIDLARDPERRIRFQADVQDYVDMSISSTINLPSVSHHADMGLDTQSFSALLASYAHRLRGFTVYPDGARGGQPLVSIPYKDAVSKLGTEFDEGVEINDVCEITGTGHCGI